MKDTMAKVPWAILAKYWKVLYIKKISENALLTHRNSLQSMQIDLWKESLPCIFLMKRFWRNRMISKIESSRKIIATLGIDRSKEVLMKENFASWISTTLLPIMRPFLHSSLVHNLSSKDFLLIAFLMSLFWIFWHHAYLLFFLCLFTVCYTLIYYILYKYSWPTDITGY